MKYVKKKLFLVMVIIAIAIFGCCLFYFKFQKELIITGFAHNRDVITIKQPKKVLATINLEGQWLTPTAFIFFMRYIISLH
jgi:hypothetical protein